MKIRLASFWINRNRPGCSITRSRDISTDHKIFVGIHQATETRDIKQEPIALASPQKVDSPPQKPSAADTQNKRAQYGILLSQEIAKFKQYPPASKQSRQQGIVVLQLQINSLGKLIAANVYQSSGYEPLDNQALEMVKKATPFSQPPIELREHDLSVLVPVSFRLN